MTNNLAPKEMGYHERIAASASALALVAQEHGLQAFLERASVEASAFQHDAGYLMDEVAMILLSSEDPAVQEHGFAILTWEAEHSPSVIQGNDLAYNAKYEEDLEFARRCFEISLLHFKYAVQDEDFVLTDDFFEFFNTTTNSMQEAGFTEIFITAIKEFTPLVMQAAGTQRPEAVVEDEEYGSYYTDEVLAAIAEIYHRESPELAEEARSLIINDARKAYCSIRMTDMSFTDAVFDGDFVRAEQIMTEHSLILSLWRPMAERLVMDADSGEWGNNAVNAILDAKPDYFSEQSKPEGEFVDFFIGQCAGIVIGALNRTDVIDMIIPAAREDAITLTAAGMAQGFGVRGNYEGMNYLLGKMSHCADKTKDAIQAVFDAAVRRSEDVIS